MKAMSGSPSTIDEYIAGFPPAVQKTLKQMRATIRKAAPDAVEAIKYRIPTFVLNGNLVHFAAFKNHIGFYPTPSGIEKFKDELSRYECAKGSVQFPVDEPMAFSLVQRIVEFRVKEARATVAVKRGSRSKTRPSAPGAFAPPAAPVRSDLPAPRVLATPIPAITEVDMAAQEKVTGPASYFPSIEKKYGKPIAHWMQVLEEAGPLKHMELVRHLKYEHQLGHGHANALVAWYLAGK